MPGRVDVATGTVSSAVNLGILEPVAIGDTVSELIGVPVHVENDVNAAALGALAHLGLASDSSLAYVNIGTGIAAGFVLGGRLWRGATGSAGEIGHIPMWSHGARCVCGQTRLRRGGGVRSGRRRRREPPGDVAGAVAWAVQLCVMTLDVDVVALGGGMTEAADFLPTLRRRTGGAGGRLADAGRARSGGPDRGHPRRTHRSAASAPCWPGPSGWARR